MSDKFHSIFLLFVQDLVNRFLWLETDVGESTVWVRWGVGIDLTLVHGEQTENQTVLETELRRPWTVGRQHGGSVTIQEEKNESELLAGHERVIEQHMGENDVWCLDHVRVKLNSATEKLMKITFAVKQFV